VPDFSNRASLTVNGGTAHTRVLWHTFAIEKLNAGFTFCGSRD
jgi:hypothetical protein